ncbi:MAG: cold shock domain-containing protein [Pseudomonadales bacterium]|nr:cold shock domain-containing protein [Pseudomonadales bacterium]
MEKGTVKWFNNAKGYGFIVAEDSDEDIFVHYSSIDMHGYRTLKTGQQVLFEAISGPNGIHATAIRPIEQLATNNDNVGNSVEANTGNIH